MARARLCGGLGLGVRVGLQGFRKACGSGRLPERPELPLTRNKAAGGELPLTVIRGLRGLRDGGRASTAGRARGRGSPELTPLAGGSWEGLVPITGGLPFS